MKLKSGRLGPWDDGADGDADDADAGEENDAKTTISCLYWLHDAASGCDILQTIWSIYACFAPLRIMMILSSSYYRAGF